MIQINKFISNMIIHTLKFTYRSYPLYIVLLWCCIFIVLFLSSIMLIIVVYLWQCCVKQLYEYISLTCFIFNCHWMKHGSLKWICSVNENDELQANVVGYRLCVLCFYDYLPRSLELSLSDWWQTSWCMTACKTRLIHTFRDFQNIPKNVTI
jgi:hypothetical protein